MSLTRREFVRNTTAVSALAALSPRLAFSADGKKLAFLPVPTDEVTNCAFGGADRRTLYATGGGVLYSVRTTTPGRVLWPAAK